MPRLSVAYGGAFVHCTPGQLRGVMRELGITLPPTPTKDSMTAEVDGALAGKDDILSVAQLAGKRLHEVLLTKFPLLHGRAVKNFGTCLRAECVRIALQGQIMRGNEVLEYLGYIAAAADAGRHLTATVIAEVEQFFKDFDPSLADQPPMATVGSMADTAHAHADYKVQDDQESQESDEVLNSFVEWAKDAQTKLKYQLAGSGTAVDSDAPIDSEEAKLIEQHFDKGLVRKAKELGFEASFIQRWQEFSTPAD